jgi:DNA-binding winged helix-turn-helix (wHTH) protein
MKVRFGAFEFDSTTRELRRLPALARSAEAGEGARVHLSPKSFDLLEILIERRPALVTKGELQDLLWPDTVVLEANLGNAVAEIRKALGDDPRAPRFVWTVSRRGYRFAADVDAGGAPDPARGHGTVRWWLVWKDTIIPLGEGASVVGRSPNSDIWIDAASVSREHAQIVIGGGRAIVEDRGSTNGTFLDGARIETPHPLVDGTTVTFGSEKAVFREWSDTAAPATEPVPSRGKRPRT